MKREKAGRRRNRSRRDAGGGGTGAGAGGNRAGTSVSGAGAGGNRAGTSVGAAASGAGAAASGAGAAASAGGGKKGDNIRLIEMAERILDGFQAMDKTEPKAPGVKEIEGALVGNEVFEFPFVFKGKDRKIELPRVLLKTGRDFQLGCVYGMLVQKMKPKLMECTGCGKVQEPTYGFGTGIVKDVIRTHCQK